MANIHPSDFPIMIDNKSMHSTYSPHPVLFDGMISPTAASAIAAQRVKPEKKTLVAKLPAHEADKAADEYPRDDWKSVRADVVYQVLSAKYTQHPLMANDLEATGERPICCGWDGLRGADIFAPSLERVRGELQKSQLRQ